MSISVEKEQLKEIIKESVSEVFEENRALFAHIIEEAIEDTFFMESMIDGESTDLVSRDVIFGLLENES